jgi:nitrogen fixation/metabolism regulation signal transduction histidine kinase
VYVGFFAIAMFRISRYVYESYPTLDFGLGLCTVDRILRNHKGKVRVSNLKNHIEPNKGVLINFTLEIPFAI